jgi:hypothetical protein
MSTTFATRDGVTYSFVVKHDGSCFLNSTPLPLQADDAEGQFTVNFIKHEDKIYLALYDNKKSVMQFYDVGGRCVVHCDLLRTLGKIIQVHHIYKPQDSPHIILICSGACGNLKFSLDDAFARVLDRTAFVPSC